MRYGKFIAKFIKHNLLEISGDHAFSFVAFCTISVINWFEPYIPRWQKTLLILARYTGTVLDYLDRCVYFGWRPRSIAFVLAHLMFIFVPYKSLFVKREFLLALVRRFCLFWVDVCLFYIRRNTGFCVNSFCQREFVMG